MTRGSNPSTTVQVFISDGYGSMRLRESVLSGAKESNNDPPQLVAFPSTRPTSNRKKLEPHQASSCHLMFNYQ
jgi:hypothetical protein